ncbi:hypothetical protein ANN_18861 [Periplaneta americana]|uniref:Transposase Tc1-like domain-containing protein n=1 Tax=Periplaneta americana TaxID=6978 RepID=A0ABQ8SR87_PERAM|nr:hypothetical protein ANN_18861 [Periplaneta americana]
MSSTIPGFRKRFQEACEKKAVARIGSRRETTVTATMVSTATDDGPEIKAIETVKKKMKKKSEMMRGVSERKVLRRIFGGVLDKSVWRIRYNNKLYEKYKSTDVVIYIKLRRLEWIGHVYRTEDHRIPRRIMEGKLFGKRAIGKPKNRWTDVVTSDSKGLFGITAWRRMALDREGWRKKIKEGPPILTTLQQTKAIGIIENNGTQADAARALNTGRGVISRMWSRYREFGSPEGQHPDKPRVTTAAQDKFLCLRALRERTSTASMLRSALQNVGNVVVSTQTIRNRLHKRGLNARRPLRCPAIRRGSQDPPVLWCQQYEDWTDDQ